MRALSSRSARNPTPLSECRNFWDPQSLKSNNFAIAHFRDRFTIPGTGVEFDSVIWEPDCSHTARLSMRFDAGRARPALAGGAAPRGRRAPVVMAVSNRADLRPVGERSPRPFRARGSLGADARKGLFGRAGGLDRRADRVERPCDRGNGVLDLARHAHFMIAPSARYFCPRCAQTPAVGRKDAALPWTFWCSAHGVRLWAREKRPMGSFLPESVLERLDPLARRGGRRRGGSAPTPGSPVVALGDAKPHRHAFTRPAGRQISRENHFGPAKQAPVCDAVP